MKQSDNKGFVFPTIVVIMFTLTLTGLTFIYMAGQRRISVENKLQRAQAFWIAEAGLERTREILKRDYLHGDGDWASGEINNDDIDDAPDADNFYVLLTTTSFGRGSYTVSLKNITDSAGDLFSDKITARATAVVGDNRRTIEADLRLWNFSPGESSIFGGGIAAGNITGNVTICGSVYIGGEGFDSEDVVLGSAGNAAILNHYEDMTSELANRISGGDPGSLGATLWVKEGMVEVSGTHRIGTKENPMDGIYLPDGENSLDESGGAKAYSRRRIGYSTHFEDLGFPSLDDVAYDFSCPTTTYIIDGDVTIDEDGIKDEAGETISEAGIFEYYNDRLVVNGRVYIRGGSLTVDGEVEYDGKGTILTDGEVDIRSDLLTDDFPESNVLAVIARGDMEISGGQVDTIMGSFYSGGMVTVGAAHVNIVGSIGAGNDFSVGNPANFYQVPGLSKHLTDQLIDYTMNLHVLTRRWELIE